MKLSKFTKTMCIWRPSEALSARISRLSDLCTKLFSNVLGWKSTIYYESSFWKRSLFDNCECRSIIYFATTFSITVVKIWKYMKWNFYWRAKLQILVLISDLVSSPLTVVCLRLCSTKIRTSHLSVSVLSADFVSSILSNCHHRPAPPTFTFD